MLYQISKCKGQNHNAKIKNDDHRVFAFSFVIFCLFMFDVVATTTSLKTLAQWSAFAGRKNTPGPRLSGYGTVPSAVMETFIGTTSEDE